MEILSNNINALATAAAAILTVLASWQVNRWQARNAEKEGDAKVASIQNELEATLWKRAKDEIHAKDAEIRALKEEHTLEVNQLKTALNQLGIEHENARKRIRSLELRLDTGDLKRND